MRRYLAAAGLRAGELLLTNKGESTTQALVLDNLGPRNLAQRIHRGVGQTDATITDRQPTIGIVENRDPLVDRGLGRSLDTRMKITLSYCRVSAFDSVPRAAGWRSFPFLSRVTAVANTCLAGDTVPVGTRLLEHQAGGSPGRAPAMPSRVRTRDFCKTPARRGPTVRCSQFGRGVSSYATITVQTGATGPGGIVSMLQSGWPIYGGLRHRLRLGLGTRGEVLT